jgi:AcrR family transcriptional regulator
MNNDPSVKNQLPDDCPVEGTRRVIDGRERVFYSGYWTRTYQASANSLEAKKYLIEALTRRLFNHTEHGLNIPGTRLEEAQQRYDEETDPALKRVKAGMLAGSLFNRATDIFRCLVDLQGCGVEIKGSDALTRECGRCLLEAMKLGRFVLHRSGEEGIDELWGEPFRAFTVPVEEFYETRYIKISQTKRDIDRIADAMAEMFTKVPAFAEIEPLIRAFAHVARIKTETLRTDPDIFDVWPRMVTAGERLASFSPTESPEAIPGLSNGHGILDGLKLIRAGRDLIFFITRARTPMPKSTEEYIERCRVYRETGRAPTAPTPLPA